MNRKFQHSITKWKTATYRLKVHRGLEKSQLVPHPSRVRTARCHRAATLRRQAVNRNQELSSLERLRISSRVWAGRSSHMSRRTWSQKRTKLWSGIKHDLQMEFISSISSWRLGSRWHATRWGINMITSSTLSRRRKVWELNHHLSTSHSHMTITSRSDCRQGGEEAAGRWQPRCWMSRWAQVQGLHVSIYHRPDSVLFSLEKSALKKNSISRVWIYQHPLKTQRFRTQVGL